MHKVVKYRYDVIMNNLNIAFPEKSNVEKAAIAKRFYRNLTDTFLESIKMISISKKTLLKRTILNMEQVDEALVQGKNVHLMAGHQFNWEFANLLASSQAKAPFIGIYLHINNPHINTIFYNFRKKYGTILISTKEFRNKIHSFFTSQYILAMAADQNPGEPSRAFWLPFFSKLAPFAPGPAKGAITNRAAVFFVGFKSEKRGYYTFSLHKLTDDASSLSAEELTIKYKNALEQAILNDPSNYLWSHRRWRWDYMPQYQLIETAN